MPDVATCRRCGGPLRSGRQFCGTRCYHDQVTLDSVAAFWDRVANVGGPGCWTWTRRRVNDYGVMKVRRRNVLAHRLSWELANGPIPPGLEVCHSCDNPPCVRPDHLFLGTHQENMDDRSTKGRARGLRRPGASNPAAKLTLDQVRVIRARLAQGSLGKHLAVEYGVTPSAISSIQTGRAWGAVD